MNVSEEEVLDATCLRAFRLATDGGRVCLSQEDYKVAVLELFGYKPSKYEVEHVWREVTRRVGSSMESEQEIEGKGPFQDPDDRGLGLERFVSIMKDRLKGRDKDELVHKMFTALDVTQSGFLTEAVCQAAFKQVVPHMKSHVFQLLFQEVDNDGDGRLSYRDFELLMKKI